MEMTVAYIAMGLGVAFLVWAALAFNRLVSAHNRVNESWSAVDVQLKRRHDIVPNLVETVKAYAEHERSVLHAVVEANEIASTSSGRRGRQAAEYELSQAVAETRALAETYPELQATDGFRRLQGQIKEIDGEIQYSRRIYNTNVLRYNDLVRGFPGALVRRIGGFRAMGYFELNPVRRTVEADADAGAEARDSRRAAAA
jgi:LemA protein